MTERALTIYSGRLRPDLTPIYKLFEGLTSVRVNVEMIYHLDVEKRILDEHADPQGDLLLTNSKVAVEAVRGGGVFEPYQAEVARGYDPWLRAPNYAWLSFTAWPRSAMVNRQILPDPKTWPTRFEDFASPELQEKASTSTVNEETMVSQVSALRAVKGNEWT